MTTTDASVFDCDSHVLEPAAIWEQHLDPEYRVPARSAFYYHLDDSGLSTVILNGKPAKPLHTSGIVRQAIWKPGMTVDDIGSLDPKQPHPINPGAYDPNARLKDMDTMGVQRSLIFPTAFAEYFPVVENPDLAYALARAYNDWVREFASAAPDRLFPAAVLPMQDLRFALAEARRVAANGFKAVFLRPSFFEGRFLNHPSYNPLWTALESLGLAAFIHPSPGSTNPEWTSEGPFVERVAKAMMIGHNIAEVVAPEMDNATALTAFAFFGHMEEYPNLKLGYAHSGAAWVTLALEKSETYMSLLSNIRDVSLHPSEIFFQRQSLVTFDAWESTVPRLHDVYANVAAWGSRYPQHDATTPQEARDHLEQYGVPGDVIASLMGGNAARFLGL
ncbi:MAG: amidohydrolase [Chloroflexi bacterium]|nr:amidohydrolase [Chloroflexota bacterium]